MRSIFYDIDRSGNLSEIRLEQRNGCPLTSEDNQLAVAQKALWDSQANFKVLTDAMPQVVWSTRPDGYHDYYNAQWYEFTGVPAGSTDGEGWAGLFHPEDQPGAWERWNHSLKTGDPYEVEYRLRHHSGEYKWTLGRALPVRDNTGTIIRWIGTCTDIHTNKMIATQNELLSQELSHRIKNIFAVISSLISLSSPQNPEAKAYASTLRERVASLGRAHEFVRPHSEESKPQVAATTLKGLLAELFEPYGMKERQRIVIEGDDAKVDDRGATPLALIFHELATNAVKYGALSTQTGKIVISVLKHADEIELTWAETGGPELQGEPLKSGFGTKLAVISVIHQLGGQLHKDWQRQGLVVTIKVKLSRLARHDLD